ncbi:hypothetical protein JYU34_018867 [Plutella xylostella]|uniref:Papilin n=1 Tax=Plutella xylostella TaxID=51655 RepID=A0ABQ7Q058_PLUXY|nr:hypothetical protein JYU34_018867 [Plutella xylostella]
MSEENGKATLRCLFHGNPPPKITWQRGKVTIDGTVGRYRLLSDGALEIVQLYRNDSGVYICVANNGLGTARQEVRLQVNVIRSVASMSRLAVALSAALVCACADPVPVSTRLRATQNKFASGSELSIPCEVDGYPTPEVHWTKDGVRLQPSDRVQLSDARLTISQLAPADSGVYGCHAANAFSSHYATLQISVEGLYIPASCYDNPFFANCALIVSGHFCHHKYYSGFCCNSCVRSGQISIEEIQSLMSSKRRK